MGNELSTEIEMSARKIFREEVAGLVMVKIPSAVLQKLLDDLPDREMAEKAALFNCRLAWLPEGRQSLVDERCEVEFHIYEKDKIICDCPGLFDLSYHAPRQEAENAPYLFLRQEAENAPDTGKALVNNTVLSKPVEETAEHQRVCMLPSLERAESTQRNALFKRVCMSHSQRWTVIIDSGSTNNLVARKMVEKLGLKPFKHPKPYQMSWVQEGHKLRVDEQCEVEFHIDEYMDKVICDVMSMSVCDILLGRPWQYDRNAVHHGKKNCYEVDKDGKNYKLVPIKDEDTAGTSETRSQFLKQVENPKEKVTKIEPTTEKATEEEVPVSSPAEEVPAAEKTVDELPATVEISAEESTVTAPASEPEAESGPAESEQVEKPKEEAGPAAKEAEPAKEETVKPAEEKAEVEGKAEE